MRSPEWPPQTWPAEAKISRLSVWRRKLVSPEDQISRARRMIAHVVSGGIFLYFCAEQEETHKKLKINTNGGNLRAAYARPTNE